MKTILCFGDSNVRGVIPEKTRGPLVRVYDKNLRWTGILQKLLGDEYNVIEEGIGGRSTQFDEINPGRPYRNGLKDFPLFLEAHFPIDLVIFLIGANDTKIQYNASVEKITDGMRQLIETVKNSNKGRDEKAPSVLLLSPVPFNNSATLFSELDKSSIEKSKQLTESYKKLSVEMQCYFLNTSEYVEASENDGLHFNESAHSVLAKAIGEKILILFE